VVVQKIQKFTAKNEKCESPPKQDCACFSAKLGVSNTPHHPFSRDLAHT